MADYPRNKIRTAKYSPLTFVPLNFWLQLHNIANIYFIFVIILNVRPPALESRHIRVLTLLFSSSLSSVPITLVLMPSP